jgi:5-formyltetrahydrofolate cyclo-ligase
VRVGYNGGMEASTSQAKNQLRRIAKQHRLCLDMPEISRQIQSYISDWTIFHAAQSIFVYAARSVEVDLLPLVSQFPNKTWYLPRTEMDTTMTFYQYQANDPLESNVYGILEPLKTAPIWDLSSRVDLIFLPSLMLDWEGRRLGFGKGYYDRFLASLSMLPCTVSPIVQGLIVEALPSESWDLPIQWAVHEAGILKFPLNASHPHSYGS